VQLAGEPADVRVLLLIYNDQTWRAEGLYD